ncbi:MAG: response regulator [Kofleriaceae bacterium]
MQSREPMGQLLIARGVLTESEIGDVLDLQAQRFPLASLCYVMGYARERPLAQVLAEHSGLSAVILDESVIHLPTLDGLTVEWARQHRVLPVYQDTERLVVAVGDPEAGGAIAEGLAADRGLRAEVLIALDVTLTTAIRRAFIARDRGDTFWIGHDAVADPDAPLGFAMVVVPMTVDEHGRVVEGDDDLGPEERTDPGAAALPDFAPEATIEAQRAVLEEATREMVSYDLLVGEAARVDRPGTDWVGAGTMMAALGDDGVPLDGATRLLVRELDAGKFPRASDAPTMPGVLVIEADPGVTAQLQRELARLGYAVDTAATGPRAVAALQAQIFALVIVDVSAPALDGWRLAQAIKHSLRLTNTRVVLSTSPVDAGPISPEDVARVRADGYLEKPVDSRRLQRVVRELVGGGVSSHHAEQAFAEAMELYQAGEVDGAIRRLRAAVADDPGSAKQRFVLANLLQRQQLVAEAVDEYEAVVTLEPSYFPALTRLAFLYYQQGHLARAVETWRRALPVCEDEAMRAHIELFMRQLVGELTGAARALADLT